MNFMMALRHFTFTTLYSMKKHWYEIVIFSLIAFYFLLFIRMNSQEGMTVNEKKKEQEKLEEMKTQSFCDGSSEEINEKCKNLQQSSCTMTSCCVYLSNAQKGKCVAGDASGPTFLEEVETPDFKADYYYFQKEKHKL